LKCIFILHFITICIANYVGVLALAVSIPCLDVERRLTVQSFPFKYSLLMCRKEVNGTKLPLSVSIPCLRVERGVAEVCDAVAGAWLGRVSVVTRGCGYSSISAAVVWIFSS